MVSVGIGLHNSAFSLVVVVCNGLHPLQREVSLIGSEEYAFLKKKTNIKGIVIDYAGLVKLWL